MYKFNILAKTLQNLKNFVGRKNGQSDNTQEKEEDLFYKNHNPINYLKSVREEIILISNHVNYCETCNEYEKCEEVEDIETDFIYYVLSIEYNYEGKDSFDIVLGLGGPSYRFKVDYDFHNETIEDINFIFHWGSISEVINCYTDLSLKLALEKLNIGELFKFVKAKEFKYELENLEGYF